MQINRFNFIRWYSNVAIDQTINIPRFANRQAKIYMPVIAIGEAFSFYINCDVPFADGSGTLDLVGQGGTVYANVSPLSVDAIPDGGGYNIYCNGVLSVPAGQYQFVIKNGATVKCISNVINVMSLSNAEKVTVPVAFRNSRDMYRFRFTDNPEYSNKIRLHLGLVEWAPEGNFEQYREVSTGTLRNEKFDLDRKVKLETYYFDDGAHEAMSVFCAMDDIQINGIKYLAKGVYNPAARSSSNVSKGEAEFYDQEISKINKYGKR